MANKQFRMENDWEHRCALISHNMLSKTNTLNFYMKKSLKKNILDGKFDFCRFLDQIWLQKTVLWTNIEKNVFLIQYLNIYNLQKHLMTTCAFYL